VFFKTLFLGFFINSCSAFGLSRENELGEFKIQEKERYNFTWYGKQNAKKIAQTPSTGTLRPSYEDSKNWDNTRLSP
jgi:adenine-specific DNA-methyltransferase